MTITQQSIGVASSASGFSGVDGILGLVVVYAGSSNQLADESHRVGPVDLTAGTVGNSDETIPTGQPTPQSPPAVTRPDAFLTQSRTIFCPRVSSTPRFSLSPSSLPPLTVMRTASSPSAARTTPSTLATSPMCMFLPYGYTTRCDC